MKQIYQSPEIEVVKMQPVQMIATSNPEGFDPTPDEEGGTGEDVLGKGGFLWSDEPEDAGY